MDNLEKKKIDAWVLLRRRVQRNHELGRERPPTEPCCLGKQIEHSWRLQRRPCCIVQAKCASRRRVVTMALVEDFESECQDSCCPASVRRRGDWTQSNRCKQSAQTRGRICLRPRSCLRECWTQRLLMRICM